jgi:hypothetical protein
MNAAAIRARDAMTARGFTEHEAVALLLPVIGEVYREAAWEADVAAGIPSVWPDTVAEAFTELGAAFTKTANDIDPPTPEES